MVGGLGMARAAHVVDERVDEISSVMSSVSMIDRGAPCGGRSFVGWFRWRLLIADESMYGELNRTERLARSLERNVHVYNNIKALLPLPRNPPPFLTHLPTLSPSPSVTASPSPLIT